MEEIVKLMKERANILTRAIEEAKLESGPYPDGHLRISVSGHNARYYWVSQNSDKLGEYIKKENRSIIPELAKKDYNQQFIVDATEELKRLKKAIAWFSKSNADLSYQKLSAQRQKLITPYIITDQLYANAWQTQNVKTNPYLEEKLVYDTKRGEKVRSKSEAIIANILYDLHIPYFYEKSLQLKKGIVRYPDFTMLHKRERKEIYLEHFGLLDEKTYLYNNLHKLDEYRENGIFPGKNLIFTYETVETPLDIKGIKEMLKELFIHS